MLNHKTSQIMALLRSGRTINIGGRPVLAPTSRKSAADRRRAYSIQLALAFAATYLIWGSTYLAIRYAVETIPPLVTAGIRHSIAGTILLAWAWARGFRPTRAHWVSGSIVGALFFLVGHGSLHWAEQYVGSGLAALLIATEPMFILVLAWSMGQQKISRRRVDGEGFELARAPGRARGFVRLVGGSGDLSQTQAAFGRAGTHRASDHLRGGDAARSRRTDGRVSRHTLGKHFAQIDFRSGLSDRLWLRGRIHRVYMAAAALSSSSGGDAHLCESSRGCVSGMAPRFRTVDHASRAGVSGDSRRDHANQQRRAGRGATRGCPRLCGSRINPGMRSVVALQFGAHDPQVIHIFATHGS